MKGLLLKEYYNTRFTILMMMLVEIGCVAILFFAMFAGGNTNEGVEMNRMDVLSPIYSTFGFFPYITAVFLSVSFEVDEKCNFSRFIVSTGVKRDTIVLSKHVLGLIFSIFPLIIVTVVGIVLHVIFPQFFNILNIFEMIVVFATGIFMINCFVVFITFTLGSVKGRIVTTFVSLVFVAALIITTIFGIGMFGGNVLTSSLICFISSFVYLLLGILFGALSITSFRKKNF